MDLVIFQSFFGTFFSHFSEHFSRWCDYKNHGVGTLIQRWGIFFSFSHVLAIWAPFKNLYSHHLKKSLFNHLFLSNFIINGKKHKNKIKIYITYVSKCISAQYYQIWLSYVFIQRRYSIFCYFYFGLRMGHSTNFEMPCLEPYCSDKIRSIMFIVFLSDCKWPEL